MPSSALCGVVAGRHGYSWSGDRPQLRIFRSQPVEEVEDTIGLRLPRRLHRRLVQAAQHSVFQGDRMTAALLDRLTHRCEIFEMNGESYRFRESMTAKKQKDPKKGN